MKAVTAIALLVFALAAPAAFAAGSAVPVNTTVPTIVGPPAQGATLTASTGTWSGTAPITYAYQWQRCTTDVTSCSAIGGATNATYVVGEADVGNRIRVQVSGTNASGQDAARSAATGVVVATSGPAPVDVVYPAVTGTPAPGNLLTTTDGTWTGAPTPTFTYAWEQCDANGANCVEVPGVTSSVYPVIDADLGFTIRSIVTAKNASGTARTESLPTAIVSTAAAATPSGGSTAPAVKVPPSLTGSAAAGATLIVAPGTWGGASPVATTVQWQRCGATGSGCTDIAGAIGTTYVVKAADTGATLRAKVTATNAAGSASAVTAVSAVVGTGAAAAPVAAPAVTPTGPPASLTVPAVDGPALRGGVLTATDGEWLSEPGIRFRHVWLRCDAKGAACAPIPHATSASYPLTADDVHHTFEVQVTATNRLGSTVATSPATPPVGTQRAIRLRGGGWSVPLAAASGQLVLTAKATATTVRVQVQDQAGNAVRGVRVAAAVGPARASGRTGTAGTVTLRLRPGSRTVTVRAGGVSVRARVPRRG